MSIRNLEEFLEHHGTRDLYESLKNNDLSHIVMKIYESMKYELLDVKTEKSDLNTRVFLLKGKAALTVQCYKDALKFCNMALSCAPTNSNAMESAYICRAALLCDVKQFKCALKDLEKCSHMDITRDLKKICHDHLHTEHFNDLFLKKRLACLLTLKPQNKIPCASKSVSVDTSGHRPVLVASEDITTGTVVISETAFSTTPISEHSHLACHYCLKPSFNMIPCDNCTTVLFCDENCKDLCFKEYHWIECKVITNLKDHTFNVAALKAVIKIKNDCDTWEKFIEMSKMVTMSKMKGNGTQKIFSDSYPLALLNANSNSYISYGHKVNAAFEVATWIKRLEESRVYFPEDENIRFSAIRATAAMLMHIILRVRHVYMEQGARNITDDDQYTINIICPGLFPLIGQLENSCDPNLFIVPMNNKLTLVALRPIPRGTPLTIAYVCHFDVPKPEDRAYLLYTKLKTVCVCKVCTGDWRNIDRSENYKLSDTQKEYLCIEFRNWQMKNVKTDEAHKRYYISLCKGLNLFKDQKYADIYIMIFVAFYRFLRELQVDLTENVCLGDISKQ